LGIGQVDSQGLRAANRRHPLRPSGLVCTRPWRPKAVPRAATSRIPRRDGLYEATVFPGGTFIFAIPLGGELVYTAINQ
jgi:hypothetical protein